MASGRLGVPARGNHAQFMADQFATAIRSLADDTIACAVSGEIDLFTAPEFKVAVNEAIASDCATVVIDLTQATFMDSSSLGALIGAHRKLSRRGRALVVACDREPILKVLRITGLDGIFTLVASVPEALTVARTG